MGPVDGDASRGSRFRRALRFHRPRPGALFGHAGLIRSARACRACKGWLSSLGAGRGLAPEIARRLAQRGLRKNENGSTPRPRGGREMPKAIRIHDFGGPEKMQWEDVEVGAPGAGQARVRHHASGLNFIDVYQRTGLYKLPLPLTLGMEGAGVVEAVGAGVTEVAVGDRVAYAAPPPGAYSEVRLSPADRLVRLPDGIPFDTAAAMMLKGMTVQYLIKRTFKVEKGMTVLLHAAAGGVGLIACQWLAALGVTVIGTVGSDAKAELVRRHGCHHPVVYTRENLVERVKEITDGKGVPVVYDSVGKDVWQGSMDCLAPLGMYVNFGNASGPMPAIEPLLLAQKGSLFLTRPTLFTYTAKREELVATAEDLFAVVLSGQVKIAIDQRYAMADAAQAHRDLESRKTTGSSVLVP
jgi:NADPH2:quinone reductase